MDVDLIFRIAAVGILSSQFLCLSHYSSVDNIHRCAQSTKSLQMLVNRTAADVAASRKRDLCIFIFAKKSS